MKALLRPMLGQLRRALSEEARREALRLAKAAFQSAKSVPAHYREIKERER